MNQQFARNALEYLVGQSVNIYHDPITEENLEGVAEIVGVFRIDSEDCAPQMVSASVRFADDEQNYPRRFRLDQVA